MTVSKRRRGRPPGTGRDDRPSLIAMAKLIAENGQLRPTTAIRRILQSPSDADIRRLQVKWKESGAALLADRLAEQKARRDVEIGRQNAAFQERMRKQQDKMAEFVSYIIGTNSPAMRMAREFQYSEAARAMREFQDSGEAQMLQEMWNSPAMRTIREMQEGPEAKALWELQNSPEMRALREMQDSPAMQAFRKFQNSPAARALREYQEGPMAEALREFQNSPAVRALREAQVHLAAQRAR